MRQSNLFAEDFDLADGSMNSPTAQVVDVICIDLNVQRNSLQNSRVNDIQ